MLNRQLLDQVQTFPSAVRELIASAEGNEHIDALGYIRVAEHQAGIERRKYSSEVEAGEAGEVFVVERRREAKRSYNNASLLMKFAEALRMTPIQTIGYLVNNNIVSLTWSITNLRNAARDLDVSMTVAQHEITDGDEADIGEVWVDGYPSYKRIEPA